MNDSTKSGSGHAFAVHGVHGLVRGIYFGRSAGDRELLQPGAKRTFDYTTPVPCRILTLSVADSDDPYRFHEPEKDTLGLWITSMQVGEEECLSEACPQAFLEEIFSNRLQSMTLQTCQTFLITVENRSTKLQIFDGRMMVQE